MRAARITLSSEERVGLGARARLDGTGPGDAVVVAAGRGFANAAGADVLEATDPAARWLLYVDTFAGLTGPEPADRELRPLRPRLRRRAAGRAGGFAGDRVVYGETPTLTLTAGSRPRPTAARWPISATTLDRPAPRRQRRDRARRRARRHQRRQPPRAPTPATTPPALAAASAQGYVLVYVDGALRVDPAALTVTADDATRSYGAANPALGARFDGFVLGQDAGDLGGALDLDHNRRAGAATSGPTRVAAGGLTSGNYAISLRRRRR